MTENKLLAKLVVACFVLPLTSYRVEALGVDVPVRVDIQKQASLTLVEDLDFGTVAISKSNFDACSDGDCVAFGIDAAGDSYAPYSQQLGTPYVGIVCSPIEPSSIYFSGGASVVTLAMGNGVDVDARVSGAYADTGRYCFNVYGEVKFSGSFADLEEIDYSTSDAKTVTVVVEY